MTEGMYAALHLLATTPAGIVTGFYPSHVLVLGALYSWLANLCRISSWRPPVTARPVR